MRNHIKLRSVALILFLVLILFTISTATAQTDSNVKTYAYIPESYIPGSDNIVSVIDTATNKVVTTVNMGEYGLIAGVAVSPDGTRLYVVNQALNVVSVVDTATNEVLTTIDVGKRPYEVAVSPDGAKLYVTNEEDETVSVIDTTTNSVIATVKVEYAPHGVVVSPDGTRVYVVNYYGIISVIDTTTNSVIASVNVGYAPNGIAVSPDGAKVYVVAGTVSGSVSIIDTATNTISGTISIERNPNRIAVTPDGTKLYVTGLAADTGRVEVIDIATNTVTATISVGTLPYGIAFTPDGTRAYVVDHYDIVSVIDTATNEVITTVPIGRGSGSFFIDIGSIPIQEKILPSANFSSNLTQDYAPLTVEFTDLSENATSRTWDFENDGIIDSTEEALIHVYTNPGTYTVNLTAINENGTDSKISTITVLEKPVAPVANFSASPLKGKAPLIVTFKDESTGSPKSWYWNFGDKSISRDQYPSHTYSKVGKYTVSLKVENAVGNNTKTISKYIIVENNPKKK